MPDQPAPPRRRLPDLTTASFVATVVGLALALLFGAVGLLSVAVGLVLALVAVVRSPEEQQHAAVALLAAIVSLGLVLLVLPVLNRW